MCTMRKWFKGKKNIMYERREERERNKKEGNNNIVV